MRIPVTRNFDINDVIGSLELRDDVQIPLDTILSFSYFGGQIKSVSLIPDDNYLKFFTAKAYYESEQQMTPEQVAQFFHETYERLAPDFSYTTRKASAVAWESVPENNKRLMIAVAGEVLERLARKPQ